MASGETGHETIKPIRKFSTNFVLYGRKHLEVKADVQVEI
jgi:hypothetical protein